MTLTPSQEAHAFHRGVSLFSLYLKLILLSFRYLIWSRFLYLIWNSILLTYFNIPASILSSLISTYFILSYQLHCCWLEVGWPSPLPTGPTHSTGERGRWWALTMTMAGGVGGGPGTWNIYTYWPKTQPGMMRHLETLLTWSWSSLPSACTSGVGTIGTSAWIRWRYCKPK